MSESAVDVHAAALVREYLTRRGFTRALEALDADRPPTPADISTRVELMRNLKLERLVRANRQRGAPARARARAAACHSVRHKVRVCA